MPQIRAQERLSTASNYNELSKKVLIKLLNLTSCSFVTFIGYSSHAYRYLVWPFISDNPLYRQTLKPLLMVTPQIYIGRLLQVRCHITTPLRLIPRPPISKPSKPVPSLTLIRPFPILPPRTPPDEVGMRSTPRPVSMNPAARPSTICPTAAVLAEHRFREERIRVGDEVIGCGL